MSISRSFTKRRPGLVCGRASLDRTRLVLATPALGLIQACNSASNFAGFDARLGNEGSIHRDCRSADVALRLRSRRSADQGLSGGEGAAGNHSAAGGDHADERVLAIGVVLERAGS